MAWLSGQQLQDGKYTIEKELGEGGFGITYRARDNQGNYVVIKTLNDAIQKRADFAKFQQDFLNEAIKLAKCSHPHIVQIYEVIHENDLWCMVMEYIDGEDLGTLVENQGVLSETEALRYIQQIGSALTLVHDNGLLHRDIKPQNIMLRAGKSEAVLIDFGIAREFSQNLTQTHTQMLADGFAPIEQYDKRAKRGAFTDVYALAATLYSALTGELPTISPMRAIGTELEEAKEINSSISDKVNHAIIKGMEIKPENRPQSINEWLELLGLNIKIPDAIQSPGGEVVKAPPKNQASPQGIIVVSDATFKSEVLDSNIVVLVFLNAPWCGPGKMVTPVVKEIALQYYGCLKVVEINTDENPLTASHYKVRSIPTFMIFMKGKKVDTVVGAVPKNALINSLSKYL